MACRAAGASCASPATRAARSARKQQRPSMTARPRRSAPCWMEPIHHDMGAESMHHVEGLRCRECGADYPHAPLHVCEQCFGPLEVVYDYAAIARSVSREIIGARPRNLWRYRELLPLLGEPTVGLYSGCTPLVRADRLAAALGVDELYVKDDSVNHPTFSYKDRVVSVAVSKAIELGL